MHSDFTLAERKQDESYHVLVYNTQMPYLKEVLRGLVLRKRLKNESSVGRKCQFSPDGISNSTQSDPKRFVNPLRINFVSRHGRKEEPKRRINPAAPALAKEIMTTKY
jgi:hypothetical protein